MRILVAAALCLAVAACGDPVPKQPHFDDLPVCSDTVTSNCVQEIPPAEDGQQEK